MDVGPFIVPVPYVKQVKVCEPCFISLDLQFLIHRIFFNSLNSNRWQMKAIYDNIDVSNVKTRYSLYICFHSKICPKRMKIIGSSVNS